MRSYLQSLLFILMLSCLCGSAFAKYVAPLPEEEAFKFSAKFQSHDTLTLRWHIAPGYYLYKDRMRVVLEASTNYQPPLPVGQIKKVDNKRLEIFTSEVEIPIATKNIATQFQAKIRYQGCSAQGFCYPPIDKLIAVNVSDGEIKVIDHAGLLHSSIIPANKISAPQESISIFSMLNNQENVKTILSTSNLFLTYLIFAGLGLLLAFTPCVLPLIPILTGIIVGQAQPVTSKRAFFLSLVYVLGSSITYSMAGILAAVMGSSLQVWLQQPWIIAATALMFFLLSLSLFGLYDLQLPSGIQNRIVHLSNRQKGGHYISVFFMGIISSLIVSPCVTAPLVGVLMFIAQTGNVALGASSLFVMGFSMGIPLILIGTSAGKLLPKTGPWMTFVKSLFGLLLLMVAIKILTRILLPEIATMMWYVFFTAAAIFLMLNLVKYSKNIFYRSAVTISLLIVIMFAAYHLPSATDQSTSQNKFLRVHSLNEFAQQITAAKQLQKPVLIDFYADWCDSCIALDKQIFKNPSLKDELEKFILLRVDVSANSAEDEKLLKYFNVVAPPTIIFYTTQGNELTSQRIVGEVSAAEFTSRINHILVNCQGSKTCV